MNPCSLQWRHRVLTTALAGKSWRCLFQFYVSGASLSSLYCHLALTETGDQESTFCPKSLLCHCWLCGLQPVAALSELPFKLSHLQRTDPKEGQQNCAELALSNPKPVWLILPVTVEGVGLREKAKSIFRNSEEGLSPGKPAEKEHRSLNFQRTKGKSE